MLADFVATNIIAIYADEDNTIHELELPRECAWVSVGDTMTLILDMSIPRHYLVLEKCWCVDGELLQIVIHVKPSEEVDDD